MPLRIVAWLWYGVVLEYTTPAGQLTGPSTFFTVFLHHQVLIDLWKYMLGYRGAKNRSRYLLFSAWPLCDANQGRVFTCFRDTMGGLFHPETCVIPTRGYRLFCYTYCTTQSGGFTTRVLSRANGICAYYVSLGFIPVLIHTTNILISATKLLRTRRSTIYITLVLQCPRIQYFI